jgi:hypothetical protein
VATLSQLLLLGIGAGTVQQHADASRLVLDQRVEIEPCRSWRRSPSSVLADNGQNRLMVKLGPTVSGSSYLPDVKRALDGEMSTCPALAAA